MRRTRTRFLALLPLFVFWTSAVPAMPPHPDLATRIQNGEIAEPYYLQHRIELASQGVNAPARTRSLDQLLRNALDENMNVLAILADFSDNNAHTPEADFDSLLFGSHISTLRHFYSEVSYGSLDLVTVNLPSALGWRRAPQSYSYYVDGQNGFGNYPHNAQRLVEDMVQLVNPVVNFSNYDNDGDGYVDALFIIHAGPGAEFTGNSNHIWSHMWRTNQQQQVDGVTAWIYSMEPEFWTSPGDMTCGVYAHEMGHSVFGLPDFYDYDYDSRGLGRWSLMAGGSWNGANGASPANPDAWCRIQMGFAEPINVTTDIVRAIIPQVEITPTIFRLWTNGQQGEEYFLVENRQQTGYDETLPSNGLLIYHVDDGVGGNDNQWYPGYTDFGHYQVALEQADGEWQLERDQSSGDVGDPYPGLDENHTFSSHSSPGSRDYNDSDTRVAVRHISNSADTVRADLVVGSRTSVVYTWLPDTLCLAGTEIRVPVTIEDPIGALTVTRVATGISFDPAILQPIAPYVTIENGIIPGSWSIVQDHSQAGLITVTAQGGPALTGQGTLFSIVFHVPADAQEGALSSLAFMSLQYNQGTPLADTTNGFLHVIAPRAEVYPNPLEFGYARVGILATHGLIIRNSGGAPMDVDSIVTGGIFTHDFASPQTLMPNEWWGVRVRVTPPQLGILTDTARVYLSASGSPVVVPISAEGAVPEISVSPMSVQFDTLEGDETGTVDLTVRDTGHWPLRVTRIGFTGNVFHVEPNASPRTIGAQDSCVWQLVFTAPNAGTFTDTLSIEHDAGDPVHIPVAGVSVPVAVDDGSDGSQLPSDYYLRPCYPNPFNAATTVQFGLPATSFVSLAVYDITGREVAVLASGVVTAGHHRILWDAREYPSGLYFVQMNAPNVRYTQKICLIR